MLCPMTVEQNAITSFKSRTTLVPTRANTVGPGLFSSPTAASARRRRAGPRHDVAGHVLWASLHHQPTQWIPSTFMPTMPGRLFFLKELAGPLEPSVTDTRTSPSVIPAKAEIHACARVTCAAPGFPPARE